MVEAIRSAMHPGRSTCNGRVCPREPRRCGCREHAEKDSKRQRRPGHNRQIRAPAGGRHGRRRGGQIDHQRVELAVCASAQSDLEALLQLPGQQAPFGGRRAQLLRYVLTVAVRSPERIPSRHTPSVARDRIRPEAATGRRRAGSAALQGIAGTELVGLSVVALDETEQSRAGRGRPVPRLLPFVQTNSFVECRWRGWSRRRSGSCRARAARPAVGCWFPPIRAMSSSRIRWPPSSGRASQLVRCWWLLSGPSASRP